MTAALHTSNITSLPLLARGKVRDNYAVGHDRILMVASDRLSAFDVIMGEPIPGKGELLTQMALFWFARLGHICPNHLTGEAPESVVRPEEVGVRPRRERRRGADGRSAHARFVALLAARRVRSRFQGGPQPAQLRQAVRARLAGSRAHRRPALAEEAASAGAAAGGDRKDGG